MQVDIRIESQCLMQDELSDVQKLLTRRIAKALEGLCFTDFGIENTQLFSAYGGRPIKEKP